MTQNEVIEMAKQAGFDFFNGWRDWGENCEYAEAWPEQIEVFAKLLAAKEREHLLKVWDNAVKAEREACANLCEDFDSQISDCCAAAIRSRGEA